MVKLHPFNKHQTLFIFVAAVLTPTFLLATCPPPAMMSFLQEAARGTWRNSLNQGITAFVCRTDMTAFFRKLQTRTSPIIFSTPEYWHSTMAKISAAGQKDPLTYIVDLACPSVEELLLQAENLKLFKIPNRWLLLNTSEYTAMPKNELVDSSSDELQCRELASALAQSVPGFRALAATDVDASLICETSEREIVLVDMWAATSLGNWSPEKGFYGDRRVPAARRLATGLNGYEMNIGLTLEQNASLEHMNDGIDTKFDVLTKFNWEVFLNVITMLNVSPTYHLSETFGYYVNGSWNGLIGMHLRGEIELSATSKALLPSRIPLVKYTNFYLPADFVFIFRAPPMSYEHNIFTQPFPLSLWLCTIGLVLLCALLLYASLKLETRLGIEDNQSDQSTQKAAGIVLSEGRKRRLEASWSDVALLSIGAVCQQGSAVEARGLTGRIITFFLFIGIVFLYVSYNASIIALLQSTSTSITSFKDLLTSKITLGFEKHAYNLNFLEKLQDPIRKEIYQKKMKGNYMTLAEGMRRVRTSYFAFHSMRSVMYAEIADTFTENEKCGLIEINNYLNLQDPMTTVSKWSENTELILLSLRRQQENGIRNRQIRRFLTPKPHCTTKEANFQSVAFIDCEAAFVVWGTGIGIAISFFIYEIFFFRYQNVRDLREING